MKEKHIRLYRSNIIERVERIWLDISPVTEDLIVNKIRLRRQLALRVLASEQQESGEWRDITDYDLLVKLRNRVTIVDVDLQKSLISTGRDFPKSIVFTSPERLKRAVQPLKTAFGINEVAYIQVVSKEVYEAIKEDKYSPLIFPDYNPDRLRRVTQNFEDNGGLITTINITSKELRDEVEHARLTYGL